MLIRPLSPSRQYRHSDKDTGAPYFRAYGKCNKRIPSWDTKPSACYAMDQLIFERLHWTLCTKALRTHSTISSHLHSYWLHSSYFSMYPPFRSKFPDFHILCMSFFWFCFASMKFHNTLPQSFLLPFLLSLFSKIDLNYRTWKLIGMPTTRALFLFSFLPKVEKSQFHHWTEKDFQISHQN